MKSQLTDKLLDDLFLYMSVPTTRFYGQAYDWEHSVLQTPFLVSIIFIYILGLGCATVDCSSNDNTKEGVLCPVPNAAFIFYITLHKEYSTSSCEFGHGYGKGIELIWVNHGCRGRFRVCFYTGSYNR